MNLQVSSYFVLGSLCFQQCWPCNHSKGLQDEINKIFAEKKVNYFIIVCILQASWYFLVLYQSYQSVEYIVVQFVQKNYFY